MKKIAWIVLLAMLLSCLAACGGGKSELEKAFTTVPVDGGVKIVAYTGNNLKLEIPSTIGKKEVVEIGDEVFAQSYLLTEIVIPDTVRKIGNRAFQGCLALEKIVIPDSVKEIGDYAFFGCWAAKTLEIGSGLNRMGSQAIQYCKSLETITVSKDNKAYATSDDGVLFTADYKALLSFPCASPLTSYTVPSNCTEIRDYAFRNCVNLESVTVGAHVTEIGENAFYTCEKLKSATLNATVEYLGYSVFANCEALEEIVIPEGVKTIGYLLEDGECGSTFSNCTALKRVVFPASLTNIYANSFYGCTSLEEIAFCGSESAWGNVMIGQGNDQLGTIKVTCNYNAQ
jgi:hypothetical protein